MAGGFVLAMVVVYADQVKLSIHAMVLTLWFSAAMAVVSSSGGLRLENARSYAETGVDYLAVGALTHSSPALDLGLDLY